MKRFVSAILLVWIGVGGITAGTTFAAQDYPSASLRTLDAQVKQAFATYTQLRTRAASIVSDGRATPETTDAEMLQAAFVGSTVRPWYEEDTQ
jgi:hypothetical protein